MEKFVFIIFLLLCVALVLSVFRSLKISPWLKTIRIVIVLAATIFYASWFLQSNVEKFADRLLRVNIINKLPQPIDFHLIKVQNADQVQNPDFILRRSGKIRPEHYRIEYLNMEKADQFWLVGYLGKKNLVYFSQHTVLDKTKPVVLEINNYINQSQKLSADATKIIEGRRLAEVSRSVWITLSFLLIFLNLVLLLRKKG